MELLAGLALGGKYLRDKHVEKSDKKIKAIRRALPNTRNIYEGKKTKKAFRKLLSTATDRYTAGQNPEESGVYPRMHNRVKFWDGINKERVQNRKNIKAGLPGKQFIEPFGNGNNRTSKDCDSMFSDEMSNYGERTLDDRSRMSMDLVDHTALFRKGDQMFNNAFNTKRELSSLKNNVMKTPNVGVPYTNIKKNAPGFLSQFDELKFDNPGGFVAKNSSPENMNKYGHIAREEIARKVANDGGYTDFNDNDSMTYGVTSKEHFSHNNMVPFFGKSNSYGSDKAMIKQQDYHKQRKLDLFTGSLKNLDYRPKTERRPLFNPMLGLTNIYGMPNFSSYMEGRYIPSRERRNEFPVQPTKVTPGLNLGYNEVSKQGFHDMHRSHRPNVDELRVATNPKVTYHKPIIHGMKGVKRGIISNVAKRRPVTFFENDPRDMVKSLGYVRAPTIRGGWDVPITNRTQTSKSWAGPAKFVRVKSQHRPESMLSKVKISHKENFKAAMPRGMGTNQHNKGHAYDMHSNVPGTTIKDLTIKQGTYGPLGAGQFQKGHAYDMQSNVPDTTIKDLTIKQGTYGPLGAGQFQKGHAYDMNTNIPDINMRNIHQKMTQYNPAGTGEHQRGHAYDMKTNVPEPTMRNVHQNITQYNPTGTAAHHKGHAFNMSDVPEATMRNIHQKMTQYNPAGTAEHHKGYAFDHFTNAPDPTLRATYQDKTYQGPIGTGEHNKGHVFDMITNIPEATLRNVHEKITQYNPAGTMEHHKAPAFDMITNIPDATMRNVHEKKTQYNPIGTQQHSKGGYLPQLAGTIAVPTMRQLSQNKTQYNPIGTRQHSKGGYIPQQAGTVAIPTMRQLTQNKTQYNPVGSQQHEKGGYSVAQSGMIAVPTMRQLTQHKTQYNPLGTQQHEKGGYKTAQAGMIAVPTMRQLTQKTTQYNPVGTQQHEKGAYDVQQQNTIAPTTLRQLTQHKTHNNPVGHYEKQRNRRDAGNSYVNVAKETIAEGRSPTTCNYAKGPTYENTVVNLCEPIQVNRKLYGTAYGHNVQDCNPTMYTRMGYSLPQTGWRSYTKYTGQNLSSNPFINNTQHRTVEY